ncbi:PREDICTED: flavonol synthase/flavanone 3-hydroxylase-like [Nicotiana attenuata]|uniref:flavonol synthase/flavanone 3-hydroxylase-like n=1 Tax=Nicotiana attenuata TaxID=49451 RepID=UPI000905A79A|nr:PREDICTED: flavonol synthase/flavanone 3-hydroxylase-like [Nicotiana attenuata]
MERKQKYARAADDIDGYGNDMVLYENQTLDWNDRIYLKVHPENDRKLKYWPENPKSFRYFWKFRRIYQQIKTDSGRAPQVHGKVFELTDDRFLKQYGDRPMERPLPFSYNKEVEGLQVLKDNKWYRVPIMPYALLVIVGDQVEIMSNGLLKSPVHRAVTNSEKERITVAMFCSPESGIDIEPVEELIDDKRPRLYKDSEGLSCNLLQYYQQGKRPIDVVKI